MKELELSVKDRTELIQEQRKQLRLVDKIVPHPGHRIWEINCVTGKIDEARYEKSNTVTAHGAVIPGQLIVNKDCYYVSALNKKNAIKKIHNLAEGKSRSNGSRIDPRGVYMKLP